MDENIRDLTVSLNEAEGREQESSEGERQARMNYEEQELDYLNQLEHTLQIEEESHARATQNLDLARRSMVSGLLRANRVDQARDLYEQIEDEDIQEEIKDIHGDMLYPQPPRPSLLSRMGNHLSENSMQYLTLAVTSTIIFFAGYFVYDYTVGRKQRARERGKIAQERIKEDYLNRQERLKEDYELGKEKICGIVTNEIYVPASGNQDSKYSLRIKTEEGNYGITILNSPKMDKESLDVLVDIDTKVCFQKGNVYSKEGVFYEEHTESSFKDNQRMGKKLAGKIEFPSNEQ